jgi:hypothetical protein
MLYVRHTVGSRLLCEPEEYKIEPLENGWEITLFTDHETAATLLKFRDELNIFDANGNEKTWYYSSGGNVQYIEGKGQVIIMADHKTVYPV